MRDTAILYAATLSKIVTVFFKYKIWLYYYEETKEKGENIEKEWREWRDLNSQPPAWQAGALTNWATPPKGAEKLAEPSLRSSC